MEIRTERKQSYGDTWQSLGCQTAPLEDWSKRNPPVDQLPYYFLPLLLHVGIRTDAHGSLLNMRHRIKAYRFKRPMELLFSTVSPTKTVRFKLTLHKSTYKAHNSARQCLDNGGNVASINMVAIDKEHGNTI